MNFISRKGLVVGTVAALTLSSITAAPAAFASTTVGAGSAVATSYLGTGTSIVEGTDFDVTVAMDPTKRYYSQTSSVGFAYTASTITKYTFSNVTADGSVTSSYFQWLPTGSATVEAWSNNGNGPDDPAGVYITASELASVETSIGFTASTDGTSINASTVGDTTFTLAAGPITADKDVTYTPFISTNAAGAFDAAAGDITGTPITIKYLNNTGTVLTAVMTGTVTGVATQDIKVTVTGPTGVNMFQMDDDLEVLVSKSATFLDDSALTTTDNVASSQVWNRETGYYSARVYNDNNASTIVGNTTAFSAQTNEIIVGQLSPDSKITSVSFTDVATADLDEDRWVRAGVKSFDISAQLFTADGSDDGAAQDTYKQSGVSVKYTAMLDGSQAAGSEIKINGTVITAAGVTLTIPTDANGIAKVTITSKDGANGDAINVRADVLASEGIVSATCSDVWEWETAYAAEIWETKDVGENDNVVGTTRNGVVTLNYEVTDQFAVPFASSGMEYQVRVILEEAETLLGSGVLTNGKATVTFPNTFLPGSNYNVDAQLWGRSTTNVLNPTWSLIAFDEDTDIYVNQIDTVGSLSATIDWEDNSSKEITHEDFFSYNFNLGGTENTPFSDSDVNSDRDAEIEGKVVDSNNVPLAGVPVTISAAGLMFEDDGLHKVDSITVYTDSSGNYEIEWYSHKAGDNLITVTSGGKTATVTATLVNPTQLRATDVLTVVAPAAVKAGTTTAVSVKLVDKWGNGINNAFINMGLVGNGFLGNFDGLTQNGIANATIVNGVNDEAGTSVAVSTNHATSTNGAAHKLVNKSVTQTMTTGSVATVRASSAKGRLTVTVENSRGETVRVFVDGKRVAVKVANKDKFTFNVNGLKAGQRKVSVSSDFQPLQNRPVTIK